MLNQQFLLYLFHMGKIRILEKDGIYHAYTRGNDGMVIFPEEIDKVVLLRKLKSLQVEFDFTVAAYCLMRNHLHILIKDKGINLPNIMNSLLDYYAKYFNGKYKHKGHVFEDRFKSKIVLNLLYFVTLLRYILRNAIAAGITKNIHEYVWASSRKELDFCNLVDFDYVLEKYSEYTDLPFTDFLNNNEHDDMKCKLELHRLTPYESEKLFNELLEQFTETGRIEDLDTEERDKLIQKANYCGISMLQISRLTGLSRKKVNEICNKHEKEYL